MAAELVTELYVFGSFARGATEPHDLDIDVALGRALRRLPLLGALVLGEFGDDLITKPGTMPAIYSGIRALSHFRW